MHENWMVQPCDCEPVLKLVDMQ